MNVFKGFSRLISTAIASASASAVLGIIPPPTVSSVVEGYFLADQEHRGAVNQLYWGETNVRFSSKWKITGSYLLTPKSHSFDEAYVAYEDGPNSVRVGRIRTEFGFSDWSELFYNGFNHIPLVRVVPLVDHLALTRDDAGAEATAKIGPLQLQASAIDAGVGSDQLSPQKISYSTVRLQSSLGGLILGADYLTKLSGDAKIYGLDARFTVPHWIFRGEAFHGDGPNSNGGYYIDAVYRIPSLSRTEIVGRIEGVANAPSTPQTILHTVGARQIINRYFSVNVNYGWGSGITDGSYAYSLGLAGWTGRLMFQVQF